MVVVADQYIELNQSRFHYRDWGGQGQPMVLLHGLASTSHIWDFVAPLLAAHYRVVALDQRGHGLSDKPPSGYDFTTIVSDLAAFIEQLQLSHPVIVGHSWGAEVAVAYAATHREGPAAIVLVDGGIGMGRSDRSWEETERAMAPPDLTHLTAAQFNSRARERWTPLREWTPELETIVLSLFEVTERGTIRPRFPRELHMQVVRAMWEHRLSDALVSVSCPVLLMPCRRTPTDEREREMMQRREAAVAEASTLLADATVCWLEDSIHDVPLQRPELVAERIHQFLIRRLGR